MKNDRLSPEESMTFTKVQIYLILGCVVAIAVLSFSLGHLVSRATPEEPVAKVVYGSDQVAEEAMEELNRLEERLDAVKTYPEEGGVSGEEPIDETLRPAEEVSVVKIEPVVEAPVNRVAVRPEPVAETPAIKKAELKPVRVKSLDRSVAKASGTPVAKPVNVKKRRVKKQTPKNRLKKPQATRGKEPASGVGLTGTRVVKPKLPPMPPQPEFKAGTKAAKKTAGGSKKPKAPKREYIPSNSKYTIQVATFPSREEAKKVEKSLKSKGYKAYIHTLARSRSVWYRVRVGGYKSKDDAVDTIIALREKEGFQAVIDRYQKAPK
jgi:cell division septation protein DedD